MKAYKDCFDNDEDGWQEPVDEKREEDFFACRTWEVVKTVPGGLAVGSFFTYRDLSYTEEYVPGLEGTVFKNIKTNKLRKLKNKNINAKKIITLALSELRGDEYLTVAFGLTVDRESVHLLWRRIKNKGTEMFKMFSFFDMLVKYVEVNDIDTSEENFEN